MFIKVKDRDAWRLYVIYKLHLRTKLHDVSYEQVTPFLYWYYASRVYNGTNKYRVS